MTRFLYAALGHVRLHLAHKRARPWAVILFATMAPASNAEPIDPHSLFEARCARCHQDHAGDFARETLLFKEGELIGKKSRKRVLDFLPNHHGKLTSGEVSALVEAFELQVRNDGLYREKCKICHDPASTLVRRTLVLRNEQLVGRYTDRNIKRLLAYHGRLSDEQQTVIYDMLVWHLTRIEDRDADKHTSSDGLQ
ncbi:MAG: hypothetical protein ACR2RF_19760 [Geminicoccaceae bacterium]